MKLCRENNKTDKNNW